MVWFATIWKTKKIICAPNYVICKCLKRRIKIILHTSLLSITHWMSQAGSSLSLALLNAVSTLAFTIVILMCFWDLKDFTAWGNCSFICCPENEKECSARRAITDRVVSYSLNINWFVIPVIAWNLESPWHI